MKRLIPGGLLVLLVVLLTACSAKPAAEPAGPPPVAEEPAEVATETYFYDARPFSDGVAWVQRQQGLWECIDERGEALFGLGSTEVPGSDFVDGSALIQWPGEYPATEYALVNKSGEKIFPPEDEWTYRFIIRGRGDYAFERTVATFDRNETQTGIVGSDGAWIIEPSADLIVRDTSPNTPANAALGFFEIVDSDSFVDLGDSTEFYDANRNEFFDSVDSVEVTSRSVEALRDDQGLVFGTTSYYDWEERNIPSTWAYELDLSLLGYACPPTDYACGFWDRNGQMTIDLTEWDGRPVGGFSDGYCSVTLNSGGEEYSTIIDGTGARMFEPLKGVTIGPVSGGRAFVADGDTEGAGYYIDMQGNVVIPGVMSGTGFGENGLALVGGPVSEGPALHYIDTDGNIAL